MCNFLKLPHKVEQEEAEKLLEEIFPYLLNEKKEEFIKYQKNQYKIIIEDRPMVSG
jgi:hypothetical protein